MEKRVYRCYPIACLLFWLVSFPPLVTCHRYLNNRVARAGYALYLRLLISSALPRNIHVRSMTLIASWHTSPKWLSPVGSKSCTGSLLNHTNVNGKWIYQRVVLSAAHIRHLHTFIFSKFINQTLIAKEIHGSIRCVYF